MSKKPPKNKKLKPAEIAYEVNELIRKNNLDIKFIKTERKPHIYKSGKLQNLWYIKYRCSKNHINNKSLSNFRKTSGCKICSGYELSIDERISELRKTHGDRYDYSEFQKEGYHSSKNHIPILCKIHGVFRQEFTSHKMGAGCRKCAGTESRTGEEIAKLVSEYSSRFMILKNYEPKKTYKGEDYLTIKCIVHEWHPSEERSVHNLLKRDHISCRTCSASKYEKEAYYALQQLGKEFQTEVLLRYPDGSLGKVDIDVTMEDGSHLFIEIDGEQHFSKDANWESDPDLSAKSFQKVKERDSKKDDYAKENNIRLVRISFDSDISAEIQKLFISEKKLPNKLKKYKVQPHQLKDKEAEAYHIHMRCQAGASSKKIADEFDILETQISKILRGNRYKDLFFSLYPEGKNPHLNSITPKHEKLSNEEEIFLTQCFEQGLLSPQIVQKFESKFKRSISRFFIKRLSVKKGYVSRHWKNLSEDQEELLINLRNQDHTFKEVAEIFTKRTGKPISRPTVQKKIKEITQRKGFKNDSSPKS